jgi:ribosomal protein L29
MKLAKDMSDQERKAALDAIKLAARTFEPMPTDKMARDMTPQERETFLRECKRRAG